MEEKKMDIILSDDLDGRFYDFEEFENIKAVKDILENVKISGDKAVFEYCRKFDNLDINELEISDDLIRKYYDELDKKVVDSLRKASENIRCFAEKQFSQLNDFETVISNNKLGQKIVPIETVGCYVPGGRYPLPSSVLMSVIPAKVAGVKEIIVCSPNITPVTIVAATIAGADKIFNIGGVQAIGAMAFGTESVPKVDKIVGPGNKYVNAAKKELYGFVGIDFIAGPSEVLIVADETASPEIVAADLLAQAEHDPDSRPDLITTSENLAYEVKRNIDLQLNNLKTSEIAEKALKNGKIVIVKSINQAIEIANKRAPEHLELFLNNPRQFINYFRNYGSLFLGEFSPEVLGDYCSGTNHTLPTNGTARFTGGLSVFNFVKILTYQEISKIGFSDLEEIAKLLAEIEGLDAHKKAVELRKTSDD